MISTLKAIIARYAAENGNKVAVSKFFKDLWYSVHESTVRNFTIEQLRTVKDLDTIITKMNLPQTNYKNVNCH